MNPHRDHPAGNDTPGGQPGAADAPADRMLEISHAHMNAAHDNGEAIPFAETVPWLVRYDDSWWVVYERGWLRITDELVTIDLNERAAQMFGDDLSDDQASMIRNGTDSHPTSDA